MVVDYHFDKAKLPKGMSFPLNRSRLDAALVQSGVSGIHCVYYWLGQAGSIVVRGEFCGEQRRGWAAAGQSSVTIYAVPSATRHSIEAAFESEFLPKLMRWLHEIQHGANTGRAGDRHFVGSWSEGVVSVEAS